MTLEYGGKPIDRDAVRQIARRAWVMSRHGMPVPLDAGFTEWFNSSFPSLLPPEPPIGSVRGGRWGGKEVIWHRRYDGYWYSASLQSEPRTWAEALAAGLDPEALWVRP